MRFVSPLLKHVVFPSLAKAGYLRRRKGPAPAVVTYHGILPQSYKTIDPDLDGSLVSAPSFREQLRLLKKHYHVISPEQFLAWCEEKQELPPRAVLLTCDDDLRNTLTEMVPMLREQHLSCLFFVTGASLGEVPAMLWFDQLYLMLLAVKENIALDLTQGDFRGRASGVQEKRRLWWILVKHLSRYDACVRISLLAKVREQLGLSEDWSSELLSDSRRARFLMLNTSELRALAEAGMALGAHTLTHPVLSEQSTEAAWNEISGSRTQLERAIGRPVWALAYPFGAAASVTAREREMAERAGFSCAFLNAGGGFGAPMPRFALPRVHVSSAMKLGEFEAHISGFYRSLRQRVLGHD
ncbi:MAG: polysaccharide deacetylase family protein [Terriglobales bacterium]